MNDDIILFLFYIGGFVLILSLSEVFYLLGNSILCFLKGEGRKRVYNRYTREYR